MYPPNAYAHLRGDLQEPQTNRAHRGSGEFGAAQAERAQPLQEQVAERGKPEPKLVTRQVVGAGPIRLEIQMHLFDHVFHLPAGTIEILVKSLRLKAAMVLLLSKAFLRQIAHDE